jgi:CRISPR-associated endonuclease/helicase Cas3
MSDPVTLNYWSVVEAVVKRRGRTLKRYHFFEELWKHLEDNKQLIFVQAPTGAGKTEAVLAPFLYGLVKGERFWHSMLYVLPTRSLVHNMFQRFCKTLNACKEDFGGPRYVVIDYDHGGFLPFKPFIEGDITITTYDTLMYTFYGFRSYGHHLFLSVGKVAGSLVVLDEIQLLQDNNWYALSLLPYHILNLLRFGATVLVISATIPHIMVEDTVKCVENEEKLRRITHKIPWKYDVVKADPTKDSVLRGNLAVSLEEGSLQDSLPNVVEDYEKPMLLVFNTVERAVNAYKALKEKGYSNLVLLHSRLISAVRKERESIFEKKEALEPEEEDLIVIATQVVEAGVDFNFKTVATEICPVDSLIQRLGRCARRTDGCALVFKEVKQTEWVYPKIVIERTLKEVDEQKLAESVQNVEVASELVNGVYAREVVEQLRSEVSKYLNGALAFIKQFSSDKIWSKRDIVNSQNHLMRLGMELRCLLPSQELYQKILAHCEKQAEGEGLVEIEDFLLKSVIELLEDNTLSLSISREVDKQLEVPSLKHRIGEREYYLVLSIGLKRFEEMPEEVEDQSQPEERARKVLRIKMISGLPQPLWQHASSSIESPIFASLFLVNPLYYEIQEGYHLGLVKPYGKS